MAGIILGLLFTSSPLFSGPLAVGFFSTASFGYVFSFFASLAVYAFLLRVLPSEPSAGQEAREREHISREGGG